MSRRPRFRIINGDRRSDPLRFWPEARRKKSGWSRYLPLWGGAIGVGLLVGVGWAYLPSDTGGGSPPSVMTITEYAEKLGRSGNGPAMASGGSGGVRAHFSFCHVGGGYNCVVDGDTLYLKG